MVKEAETPKTPFQLSMNELGKKLSYLSGGIIIVIVLLGIIQGREWLEMFTIGGHCLYFCLLFYFIY
jgi:P-type Ca2+ transporter type 2C